MSDRTVLGRTVSGRTVSISPVSGRTVSGRMESSSTVSDSPRPLGSIMLQVIPERNPPAVCTF